MNARFTAQVAAVSGGLALAAMILVEGWGGGGGWPLLAVGSLLAVVSLFGLVLLGRIVVLDRRLGSRR